MLLENEQVFSLTELIVFHFWSVVVNFFTQFLFEIYSRSHGGLLCDLWSLDSLLVWAKVGG